MRSDQAPDLLWAAGLAPGVLPEVRRARAMRFPESFVKQNLENTPGLVGAGQVRPGAGPALGLWAGPRVLSEVHPARTVRFLENFM